MKKLRNWLLLLAALLFPLSAASEPEVAVRFYNYGKADAILITTPGGKRILIDTAWEEDGGDLVSKLQSEGIAKLDLLIITHYDRDHVGGAAKVLKKLKVASVVRPDYDGSGAEYKAFRKQLKKQEPEDLVMKAGTVYEVPLNEAGLTFTIYAAEKKTYGENEENDYSLACRLVYGETTYLFTGDAEAARQTELLLEGLCRCDVLKVPYHGKAENTSAAFLRACHPKIAYITDSDEDPADNLLLWLLDEQGTEILRASKDGSVTVYSDGKNLRTKK